MVNVIASFGRSELTMELEVMFNERSLELEVASRRRGGWRSLNEVAGAGVRVRAVCCDH